MQSVVRTNANDWSGRMQTGVQVECNFALSEQLSYFSKIQHITAEIERLKKASERKRITVYRAGGAFGREVAERAKELLNAWGFTAIQNIALDDERCDLRIDDRTRLSYGAGVRGLYLSSLVVALMEHALEKSHPHLGIVVLDSQTCSMTDSGLNRPICLATLRKSSRVKPSRLPLMLI